MGRNILLATALLTVGVCSVVPLAGSRAISLAHHTRMPSILAYAHTKVFTSPPGETFHQLAVLKLHKEIANRVAAWNTQRPTTPITS